MKARLLLVLTVLALSACDRTKEPDSSDPPATPHAERQHKAVVERPSPTPSGGVPAQVAWDAPASWRKAENASPMRLATYKIPHVAPDTEDAELSVTVAGGSVESNVTRWAGQFDVKPGDVKREERKVGDLRVTIVDLRGAYTPMAMPGAAPGGGPKAGSALLGAIVETSPGARGLTFFKLTGPEKTVLAARGDFEKLVKSLHVK